MPGRICLHGHPWHRVERLHNYSTASATKPTEPSCAPVAAACLLRRAVGCWSRRNAADSLWHLPSAYIRVVFQSSSLRKSVWILSVFLGSVQECVKNWLEPLNPPYVGPLKARTFDFPFCQHGRLGRPTATLPTAWRAALAISITSTVSIAQLTTRAGWRGTLALAPGSMGRFPCLASRRHHGHRRRRSNHLHHRLGCLRRRRSLLSRQEQSSSLLHCHCPWKNRNRNRPHPSH